MNITEVLNLSLTAILANKLRSFLTILGIVIGVTSVILLISVVTGLKSFITNEISGLGSNLIFVIPGELGGGRGPGGIVVNKLTLQDSINLKNGLVKDAQVSAAIQKVSTLKFQSKESKGVTVIGAESNYPEIIKSTKIEEGRFFNSSENNSGKKVAVIGTTVKERLFPNSSAINQDVLIGGIRYKVIGILKKQGAAIGIDQDNTVILPLETAMKQFGITNVQSIYVSANDATKVKEIQAKTESILLKRLSDDDFTVQNQEQTLETISQITSVLTMALGGIAAISLVVGGIGIMNIMLVSVTERTKEIGLRKAIGARPKDIRNQFLIEAITLSALGGIVGIILGYLLSLIVNIFIQTVIPLWAVALSFGFSMLVGVIFGVTPAIRAARLNPIQALRYE